MHHLDRKIITTLLLGLLALPSLVFADNLRENYSSEANCKCTFDSPATSAEEQKQRTRCNEQQKAEKPVRLPFEVFRFNEYRRGPLLLR